MAKGKKIAYWIATIWLAFGLLSTGFVQLMQMPDELALMSRLGYPGNLLILLGVLKVMAAIVILLPRYPLVKEWAYAGVFFNMAGAVFSHVMVHDTPEHFVGPTLFLLLAAVSWYFRPEERTLFYFHRESSRNPITR